MVSLCDFRPVLLDGAGYRPRVRRRVSVSLTRHRWPRPADCDRRGEVTALGCPNDFAAWLREITRRGQARDKCAPSFSLQSLSISALGDVDATTTSRICAENYYLCELKLPHGCSSRQALRYPQTPRPCFTLRSNPLGGSVRRSRRTTARASDCGLCG
jgi:hypothetical protein